MTDTTKKVYRKPYAPEFKERAVRMVRQLRIETGQNQGAIQRVADQLDCGPESLRTWVRQDEVDVGEAPGTTTAEAAQIKALEQENRELRRANAILKSASAFFAAELDRPQK
jgi:transposase